MSGEDLAKVNLFSLQAIEYLRDTLSNLLKEIAILKDERDEYRRKWLETINENPNIK